MFTSKQNILTKAIYLLLSLVLSCSFLQAITVYNINNSIGSGLVTGTITIETDAAQPLNILSYSLHIDDGQNNGGAVDLNELNSTFNFNSGLQSDGNELRVVENGGDEIVLTSSLTPGGSFNLAWVIDFACGNCNGRVADASGNVVVAASLSDPLVIGTASSVPEPNSILLFAIGLFLFIKQKTTRYTKP